MEITKQGNFFVLLSSLKEATDAQLTKKLKLVSTRCQRESNFTVPFRVYHTHFLAKCQQERFEVYFFVLNNRAE